MDSARATQLALGYWPARAFSAAVELGVFDALTAGALTATELAERLGIRSPSLPDLLDALVGLGALERDGDRYAAGGPVDPGLADLAGTDAYHAWAALPEALRHRPRPSMFEHLAADPDELARFLAAMGAVSAPGHAALAEQVAFTGTVCDLGGADGRLALVLARRHPGVRVITFDLPAVTPFALERIDAADLGDRVTVAAGDFFADPLPPVDAVVLSLVLLDWDTDRKRHLLRAAAGALRPGGRIVILDRLDDGHRPERTTFELLRSLHLLVTQGDAFPYTADDLTAWLAEAGFGEPSLTPVEGGFTLAVAERTG